MINMFKYSYTVKKDNIWGYSWRFHKRRMTRGEPIDYDTKKRTLNIMNRLKKDFFFREQQSIRHGGHQFPEYADNL